MLQVHSAHALSSVEAAVRAAAQHHDATIHGVAQIGQHLRESGSARDAISIAVCAPELYAALLASDVHAAALLPCRIAAYTEGSGVMLEALSPVELCRLINRADLAAIAVPLEALLLAIMEEAAQGKPAAAHAHAGQLHTGGLGATEEQVNERATVPQRIDAHGTKVEELGGTGQPDAQGG